MGKEDIYKNNPEGEDVGKGETWKKWREET